MSDPPVLRVVAGGPLDEEEAAALTAVLAAVASAGGAVDEKPKGSGRWRRSARPAAPAARSGWLDDARRSALRRPQ